MSADRVPVWEMSCGALDLVLGTAFDWRELDNLMRGCEGEAAEAPCAAGMMSLQDRSVHIAHALCHKPRRFSKLLQKRLDLQCAAELTRIEGLGLRELMPEAVSLPLKRGQALVSLTWAMARDRRPEVQRLVPLLLSRIQVAAYQALLQVGEPASSDSSSAVSGAADDVR